MEEIAGFSSSSPYVFNIVDSKNVRDESNESVGYYIGSSKMQYGVNYIIEEGSEVRGIASGEVESSGDRGVNRLVFLKNKYNYSGRVKSLVGSDGENLVIGVEGREPTEAEVLLYDIELSADGLRWEASNVNLGVFKFSYGGLDGGVNSVGRKICRPLRDQYVTLYFLRVV